MSDPSIFPAWITEAVNKDADQINPKSREFFEKLLELAPHFDQAFLSIPATSTLGVLKSHDPKEVQRHFGFASPQEFILFTEIELFHFQATYQLRELAISLLNNLEEGRFYVAAIISRSMLEVVCINYYSFRRADKQFRQCLEMIRNAAKTKSKTERSRLVTRYRQGIYEIYSTVFYGNTASSINWSNFMQDRSRPLIKANNIHVNEAIRDLEKQSGFPLGNAYNLLSEFVHPNAGSKMLIVNTRKSLYPLMDSLIIGENKGNHEAAFFYIDHLSESMFYAWTLALGMFHRGQELIAVLDNLIPEGGSRSVH